MCKNRRFPRLLFVIGLFVGFHAISPAMASDESFASDSGTDAPPLAAVPKEGLNIGNELSWAQLRGQVTVICHDPVGGGQDIFTWSCQGSTLEPAEYARFVSLPGGEATRVRLSCTREDGSVQTKTAPYKANEGMSDKVNLWIATLFQRPLLAPGLNRIQFELMRADASIERSGEFEVKVSRGPDRVCRPRVLPSNAMQDCRSGLLACERYFFLENYCRN